MKHLLSILLLLAWVPGAALGQNPLDSLFFVEKEDYMSTLSIKPVEDPLGLLMRVLERLEKDMQQKHSRREYQLEATLNIRTPPRLSVNRTFTVEDDNGIEIQQCEEGPLHFEGPFIITLDDSLDVELAVGGPYTNDMYVEWCGTALSLTRMFSDRKLKAIHKSIKKIYNVTAYSIEDETGRGIYRIHFDKKELEDRNLRGMKIGSNIKWYLDRETLRLTQINCDRFVNRHRGLCRCDYGEENGAPVLQNYTELAVWNRFVIHKVSIRLAE